MTRWTIILASFLILTGCVTTTPTSFQQAYHQAKVYGPTTNRQTVGVVLYLHGCGGLSVNDVTWWWAHFFIQHGWEFVALNSLADSRPKPICQAYPGFRSTKEWIHQLRATQTRYALEQLVIDYPGLPIVIWGHSEGAAVANLISEPVAGILTTGHRCGYWNHGWTKFNPAVPVLVIVGARDPYTPESKKQIQSNCKRVLKSEEWDYLVLDKVGHLPEPQKRPVKQRVLAWLDNLVK